jgi:hypothetical protein
LLATFDPATLCCPVSLRTGHHSTVLAGPQRRRVSAALRKADAALRLALPWQRLEKVWRGKAGRRDSGRRRRAITDCARALGLQGARRWTMMNSNTSASGRESERL